MCDNAHVPAGRNCCRSATVHDFIEEGQEYETNAHDFDEEGEVEVELCNIWEANVTNQSDQKTGRYIGNKSGNKGTGFKKGQNQKRQANEVQGTSSHVYMDRDTWNALEE